MIVDPDIEYLQIGTLRCSSFAQSVRKNRQLRDELVDAAAQGQGERHGMAQWLKDDAATEGLLGEAALLVAAGDHQGSAAARVAGRLAAAELLQAGPVAVAMYARAFLADAIDVAVADGADADVVARLREEDGLWAAQEAARRADLTARLRNMEIHAQRMNAGLGTTVAGLEMKVRQLHGVVHGTDPVRGLAEARVVVRELQSLRRTTASLVLLGQSLTLMANQERKVGLLSDALVSAKDAVACNEQLERTAATTKALAASMNALGLVHVELRQIGEAHATFAALRRLDLARGEPDSWSYLHGNALAYVAENAFDEALLLLNTLSSRIPPSEPKHAHVASEIASVERARRAFGRSLASQAAKSCSSCSLPGASVQAATGSFCSDGCLTRKNAQHRRHAST